MNCWSANVDKVMMWSSGRWIKTDQISPTFLRMYYDQLLITSETKIIESFNMNGQIKGFFRGDVLILVVSTNKQEIRKLKFQIKSNVTETLQILSSRFPLINHKSSTTDNIVQPIYRQLNEVLKNALVSPESMSTFELPPGYENFVRLCLLDPAFPKFVQDTELILQDIFKK